MPGLADSRTGGSTSSGSSVTSSEACVGELRVLEPQERSLLLESLRPPEGFELDHAVGTTFTLDLTALIAAPLAFTFFSLDTADGGPTDDPVAILKATREYADRITVF